MNSVTLGIFCRFLVFKDWKGRTQVHRNGCNFLGQKGIDQCGCRLRLSYKTLDIGKLRAIFHAIGRTGEWDQRLDLGNPATDKSVKDYLSVVNTEQLQAQVQPKQAIPFFIDKLDWLVSHIERSVESSSISITHRFILAWDQAHFKAVYFSRDRPDDMGQVKVPEILRFPNNDGFLFNHIRGKTLRGGDSNILGIQGNPQTLLGSGYWTVFGYF